MDGFGGLLRESALHDAIGFLGRYGDAGLSAELGAGRDVLFHRGVAETKTGFAGIGDRFAA